MSITRRGFISSIAAVALQKLLPVPQRAEATLIKRESLIQHWGSPNLLETPLKELGRSWITPNNLFFVLNHDSVKISSTEQENWKISVGGEVENPVQFWIKDLFDSSKFEQIKLPAYIQCAGNGRRFFKPEIDDVPWGHGAIGNAIWSGVRLADVLRLAQVKRNAKHIAFMGKDAPLQQQRPYIKSIPIRKATDPQTVLAVHMNGVPLPVVHGGPLRMIVPGWAGTYSTKWLTHILALEQPWDGFWMNRAFLVPKYPVAPGTRVPLSDTESFTEFSVNSLITEPCDNERRQAGPVQIKGFAWSGETEVVGLEVSTDSGQSWHPATLQPQRVQYAWTQWFFTWNASPGSYVIMVRATDSSGKVQTLQQDNWNPGGYGWHAIHSILVAVE